MKGKEAEVYIKLFDLKNASYIEILLKYLLNISPLLRNTLGRMNDK